MQHMSGHDLQPFIDRYVLGTGIPQIHYRYTVDRATDGEGWVVRGEATQISRARQSHSIARDADGQWELRTEYTAGEEFDDSLLIVPFQIVVTSPDEVQKNIDDGVQSARGFGGRLVIEGASLFLRHDLPGYSYSVSA